MRSFQSAVIVLTLVISSSFLSAQQDRLQFQIFDIESFSRTVADAPVSDWELPIRQAYRIREEGMNGENAESEDSARAEFLVRMIRDAVGPEAWDAGGTFMRLNDAGNRLLVRNSPAILKKIGRFIQALGSQSDSVCQVEVLVLSANAGTLPSLGADKFVMSSTKFDSLQRGRDNSQKILMSAKGQAVDGQRLRLRSVTMNHAVGLQNAQIAQSATKTEPGIIKVPSGLDVYVRPTLLPNGTINLRVQGTLTDGLKIDEHVSRSAGVAAIQLPNLRVRKFTSSGVVALGQGLVVGTVASADKAPRFIVVRALAKPLTQPEYAGPRGVTKIYNAGFLTQPYLGVPRLVLGSLIYGPDLYSGFEGVDPVFSADRNYLLPESAYDLIRQTVTPSYWEDNLYTLEFSGNQLWVTAGAEQHNGIKQLLDQLSTSKGRPTAVSTYCILANRALVAAKRAAKDEDWIRAVLREPGTLRLYTAVGACETGSRVEWLDGREFAYVSGASVEVAQGADIAVPKVETGFSGLYLRLAPCLTNGGFGLDFRVELNLPKKSGKDLTDYDSSDFDISLPKASWQQASGHVKCKPNQYTLLAEFGVGTDQVALIVTRMQP